MKHKPISADTHLILLNIWLAVFVSVQTFPAEFKAIGAILLAAYSFWQLTKPSQPETP